MSPEAEAVFRDELVRVRADRLSLLAEREAAAAAMAVLLDALNRAFPAPVVKHVVKRARAARVKVLAESLRREILSGGSEC